MQFSYSKLAGKQSLEISLDTHKHLIKVRRHKIKDEVYFRNLVDDYIYLYEFIKISKNSSILSLKNSKKLICKNKKKLHLAWCIIDPKIIEKSIASLNELGVDKITFIYCQYSQHNFKINLEKLNKILINSSIQCGRSNIITLEICKSLEEFLEINENTYILDFSKNNIDDKKDEIKTLLIGCEGGFSSNEKNIFKNSQVLGFETNLILKSKTAIVCASSKILL